MMEWDALKSFFEELDLQTTVLTPNRRLSATLHKLYVNNQITHQQKIWQTPDILPFSSFLERLWLDYVSWQGKSERLLLNSTQELFLWEQIITKMSSDLLQISETAELAKSAWDLLKQWQIELDQPAFNNAEDYLALQTWATQFKITCEKKNGLDKASLPDQLTEKIANGEIKPPKKIILTGFTEFSPQLKKFLHECKKTGSIVKEISLTRKHSKCYRISLRDEEEEIVTIARWAKSLNRQNPEAKIGCVIPSLEKKRDRVQQVFAELLGKTSLFNISVGKKLLQYPIIYTALQILSLYKKKIPVESLSYLLASPFMGESEVERIQRANLDSVLRQKNIINFNLITEKIILEQTCPALFKRIQNLLNFFRETQNKLTYAEWSKVFTQMLNLLGWPGERSLSSEEYQVIENWLKLLGNFVLLDQIAEPIYLSQALQSLYKMTAKTLFQPQTPEAPIQVLGILEAAAIPFDFLWVAGLDDLAWPAQPRPNPLIPKHIQREHHMPHATSERELKFCQEITEQFKQAASQVIFSYAEKSDELELQASPLIRNFKEIDIPFLALDDYQSIKDKIFLSRKIETMADEIAPSHANQAKIIGGVSILKQQALCPFKAFAEWRLYATDLEKTLPGLRAKDRGTLIHKTLEILWNQLKNHKNLIETQDENLHQLIDTCINQAFNPSLHSGGESSQYMRLEKERMHRLIWDWLHIEKEREPFTVLNNEKAEKITLNELTFSVRIDRIDELTNGKKLIIDYKTGKYNEINSWFSERPEEPQLPLYSLIDPEKTAGITFAQVATGEHCFKGVSQYALGIKGIKIIAEIKKTTALSWEEQLTQWKGVLTQLADDFYQGKAHVAPKDDATCVWCSLKPLCRVNEDC